MAMRFILSRFNHLRHNLSDLILKWLKTAPVGQYVVSHSNNTWEEELGNLVDLMGGVGSGPDSRIE